MFLAPSSSNHANRADVALHSKDIAAALFGEMHGMVAAAVAHANGETTPAYIAETTNVSPIDLHHAVADMVSAGLCTIADGTVRLADTPPQKLLDLTKQHVHASRLKSNCFIK